MRVGGKEASPSVECLGDEHVSTRTTSHFIEGAHTVVDGGERSPVRGVLKGRGLKKKNEVALWVVAAHQCVMSTARLLHRLAVIGDH